MKKVKAFFEKHFRRTNRILEKVLQITLKDRAQHTTRENLYITGHGERWTKPAVRHHHRPLGVSVIKKTDIKFDNDVEEL